MAATSRKRGTPVGKGLDPFHSSISIITRTSADWRRGTAWQPSPTCNDRVFVGKGLDPFRSSISIITHAFGTAWQPSPTRGTEWQPSPTRGTAWQPSPTPLSGQRGNGPLQEIDNRRYCRPSCRARLRRVWRWYAVDVLPPQSADIDNCERYSRMEVRHALANLKKKRHSCRLFLLIKNTNFPGLLRSCTNPEGRRGLMEQNLPRPVRSRYLHVITGFPPTSR